MSALAALRRAAAPCAVAASVAVLAACATGGRDGGYYRDDGPPDVPAIDPMGVPDAMPRDEPVLASAANRPYDVFGRTYRPLSSASGYRARGIASWYGKRFHGRRTSSGEPYDMYAMTAAHRTLPIPSYVRVRNLVNERTVVVKINDRGPFRDNRLIDVSYAAAARLGMIGTGTASVEIETVLPAAGTRAAGVSAPGVRRSAPGGAPVKSAVPVSAGNAAGPKTAPETGVWIQVGAFRDPDNARRLHARLQDDGVSPVVIQPVVADGVRYYRVRVGPLHRESAADVLARLDPGLVSAPRVMLE